MEGGALEETTVEESVVETEDSTKTVEVEAEAAATEESDLQRVHRMESSGQV